MEENFFSQIPEFTPDVAKLDMKMGHLVFDPGPIFSKVPYHRTAYTLERMSLWKHKNGDQSEAIALRMPMSPRARVRGTLYAMTTDMVMKLDNYRQNGVSFERTKVPIIIPVNGRPERFPQLVWMYKATKDHWEDRIVSSIGSMRLAKGLTYNSEFQLADVYSDNDRFFNNHFAYNGLCVEALDLPEIIEHPATERLVNMVRIRNQREVDRLHGPISRIYRRLKGYF